MSDDDVQVHHLKALIRRARPWINATSSTWPNHEVIDVKRAMDQALDLAVDDDDVGHTRAMVRAACAEAFHQGRSGDDSETMEAVINRIVDDAMRGVR